MLHIHGATRAVLPALRAHSTNPRVVLSVLNMLYVTCGNKYVMKEMVTQCGLVPAVLGAAQGLDWNVDAAQEALQLLKIMADVPEFGPTLREASAVQGLVAMLEQHSNHTRVLQLAWATLWELTADEEGRLAALRWGGVTATLAALADHFDEETVSAYGLRVLTYWAASPAVAAEVARRGAPLVVRFLHLFMLHATLDMLVVTLQLLAMLAEQPATLLPLLSEGALDKVVAVAESPLGDSASVALRCGAFLQHLVKPCDDRGLQGELDQLRRAASSLMARHSKRQTPPPPKKGAAEAAATADAAMSAKVVAVCTKAIGSSSALKRRSVMLVTNELVRITGRAKAHAPSKTRGGGVDPGDAQKRLSQGTPAKLWKKQERFKVILRLRSNLTTLQWRPEADSGAAGAGAGAGSDGAGAGELDLHSQPLVLKLGLPVGHKGGGSKMFSSKKGAPAKQSLYIASRLGQRLLLHVSFRTDDQVKYWHTCLRSIIERSPFALELKQHIIEEEELEGGELHPAAHVVSHHHQHGTVSRQGSSRMNPAFHATAAEPPQPPPRSGKVSKTARLKALADKEAETGDGLLGGVW